MKLKVIVDNNTYIDQYYLGEPAACYYMEDGGEKMLLDTGYSDVFLKNMEKMQLDMKDIKTIAISHGHDDHTGGLFSLFHNGAREDLRVVAHPDAFLEKEADGLKIGSPLSKEEIRKKCRLILTKEPLWLTENIVFLGEIPRIMDFEASGAIGKQVKNGVEQEDFVMDDSALAYKGREGVYIISGCSHSGICNIMERAKEVCRAERIAGVIGGLHLFHADRRIEKTIAYFKENGVRELYPCHCTSFGVKAMLNREIPVGEVGVNMELYWK